MPTKEARHELHCCYMDKLYAGNFLEITLEIFDFMCLQGAAKHSSEAQKNTLVFCGWIQPSEGPATVLCIDRVVNYWTHFNAAGE